VITYNAELAELAEIVLVCVFRGLCVDRPPQRGSGASGGFTPGGSGVLAVFITIASIV
jgi:hypothetical protein